MNTRPAERQEGADKQGQKTTETHETKTTHTQEGGKPHPDSNPNTDPKNPINK
jgi:hypothetical protein